MTDQKRRDTKGGLGALLDESSMVKPHAPLCFEEMDAEMEPLDRTMVGLLLDMYEALYGVSFARDGRAVHPNRVRVVRDSSGSIKRIVVN